MSAALVDLLRDEGPLRLVLLAWCGVFLLLLAARLRRRTRVGRSLSAAMAALGVAYLYAVGRRVLPGIDEPLWLLLAVRFGAAASVTWAVVELVRLDRRRE